MKKSYYLFILFLGLSVSFVYGQKKEEKGIIQFSGVVLDGDSLQPVPFTSIIVGQFKMQLHTV